MGIKSALIRPLAWMIHKRIKRDGLKAINDQEKIRKKLIEQAKHTAFGKDHGFVEIKTAEDFRKHIPVKDYEQLRPYFDRVAKGERDVLWPGIPKYLAKTSGTTSGVKYIPITKESVGNHFNTARDASLNHAYLSNNLQIFEGKLIFLSGSPTLEEKGGIKTGRLSGIVNHEIPSWVKRSQLPSYQTNCINDWEDKLDKIVEETHDQDLRMISGIPPWVQMYYEKLLQKTGAENIREIFPNFSTFTYGGVNFEPYRSSLEKLTGAEILSLETYPASEGFIAFQDQVSNEGLLLNTNSGIYFEFVPVAEILNEKPIRLGLDEIELNRDYALIMNSNAGLWGYSIGDTVQFVSKDPYRIIVSGRIKHFISAFGEHVIGKEVDQAILELSQRFRIPISEFTVAPQVKPLEGEAPYHEWFIEFAERPKNINELERFLDSALQRQNIYYRDLRNGKVLDCARIKILSTGSFRRYMESKGKLGGQNKVPRLSNDRILVDQLMT